MKYSQIPAKFGIPWANNAGGGYINPIPQASQIGIANGRASLTDGFVPLNFLPVGAGGIPPFGADTNGILNQITAWNRWQGAGGLPKYDSAFATTINGYPFGALLAGSTSGVLWLNTVDDNITNPESAGVGWVNVGTQAAPFSVGTDAGSANVMTATVSPAPTSYVDGAVFFIKKTGATNNGAMIGSVNALANQPIVNRDGTALTPGQWPASSDAILIYRASLSSLVLLTPTVTAAANGGLSFTAEGVGKLAIETLLAPTGAIALADKLALFNQADSADRSITLTQLATAIFALFGQYLGSSGYQVLPGGLILQWMPGPLDPANTSEPQHTLSWPITFPNNCFNALISSALSSSSGVGSDFNYILTGNPTVSQVSYYRNWQPGGAISNTTSPFIWGIGN